MASGFSVQADEAWGQACLGYQLQIDLAATGRARGAAASREFARLQARLAALELPMGLRATPPATMHVSVYAFIPVAWQSADKDAAWQEVAPRAQRSLSRACATGHSFSLPFARVRVFPRAIVLVAEPPPPFVLELRARLRETLTGSAVPPPHYDLVHTTLARFSESGALTPSQVAAIESLPVAFSCRVRALRLVRERIYPSLSLDELARFSLAT